MKPSKTKNPYFFEEVEDPALWKIDKNFKWMIYLVIVLAIMLFMAKTYKQIKLESEKKFPEIHEAKTR